jgi:hypothetical protein
MGFSALILEPDQSSRARFRQLTEANAGFSRCIASSTLAEGGERLRRGLTFDAIYISTRFDPAIVSQFIATARKITVKDNPAQLIVVARDSSSPSMRQYDVGKPDGYLLEPLVPRDLDGSVDFVKQYKEIHSVAESGELEVQPVCAVNIKALCARMAVAIDRGKPGLKDLRELSKRVELLSEEQKLEYYEELVKYMSEFRLPGKRDSGSRV